MKQHVDLNGKTILVTGSPGFIGANLVLRLLREMTSGTVISLDNMNDYYDPALKEYRLSLIEKATEYSPVKHVFIKGSIADKALIDRVFVEYKPAVVVNLAAQAGVRYSIDHPDVYIESNLIGFYNILEACRHNPVEHLVYASSSSVYGGNKKVPFSTDDKVDNPVSLYAATKKSNELLAHSYSKLYNIPSTGLRFFTVYGPAGRPDMFYFSATQKLVKGETISIFNYGNCKRDFTFVDDIVEGVLRVMQGAPEKENGEDGLPLPPYAVYNIGGGTPENLLDYISTLQEELVRAGVLPEDYDFEAHRKLVGMQPGDVPVTYADSTGLERDYGFKPSIGIREGLRAFAEWYKEYYKSVYIKTVNWDIIKSSNDPCGAYTHQIVWHPPISSGYIIQYVSVDDNLNLLNNYTMPYYEAWKVENGVVVHEGSGSDEYDDSFSNEGDGEFSFITETTIDSIQRKMKECEVEEASITYNCLVYWAEKGSKVAEEVSNWSSGIDNGIKNQFQFRKTRYRGTAKLKTKLSILCASANYYMLARSRRAEIEAKSLLAFLYEAAPQG